MSASGLTLSDIKDGTAEWSVALDALRFFVPGHDAPCSVHRLAFKAILDVSPEKETCLACFAHNQAAFVSAALDKIKRQNIAIDRSLHLNSRDIRRALGAYMAAGPQRACRVLDRNSDL